MVYITGDTHRVYDDIEAFCKRNKTTKNDLIIILGDNGVNYYGGRPDNRIKNRLSSLPITFFFIRGNHDMRPSGKTYLNTYSHIVNGRVLMEEQYPTLLFAMDGEPYRINGKTCFVIGGAYSVDKHIILQLNIAGNNNYKWFEDEQLSKEEMKAAESALGRLNWNVDYVFTHTCPDKYIPREKFIPSIDQSKVDNTMEHWLGSIEDRLIYSKWFCGHWHTDKITGRMRFMYKDIIPLP